MTVKIEPTAAERLALAEELIQRWERGELPPLGPEHEHIYAAASALVDSMAKSHVMS